MNTALSDVCSLAAHPRTRLCMSSKLTCLGQPACSDRGSFDIGGHTRLGKSCCTLQIHLAHA